MENTIQEWIWLIQIYIIYQIELTFFQPIQTANGRIIKQRNFRLHTQSFLTWFRGSQVKQETEAIPNNYADEHQLLNENTKSQSKSFAMTHINSNSLKESQSNVSIQLW